jgi:hypothetical protein
MLAAVGAAAAAAAGADVLSLTSADWEHYCSYVERTQASPSAEAPPYKPIFNEQKLMYAFADADFTAVFLITNPSLGVPGKWTGVA